MYLFQINVNLAQLVRTATDLEAQIVAVERIDEYSRSPSEAEWVIERNRPPPSWPPEGHVTFDKYCTRYRPNLDLVLRGISCDIQPGQKVWHKMSSYLAIFLIT